MSINFTTSGFTRLGAIGGGYLNAVAYLGDTNTNTTATWGQMSVTASSVGDSIDDIESEYQSTNQNLVDGLYSQRDNARNALNGLLQYLASLSATTIYQMAYDDDTLTTNQLSEAVQEWIDQMGSTVTIKKNTTSVSVAASGSNTGDATVLSSIVNSKGVTMEYVFAEAIKGRVTSDSTAGSELITFSGEIAASGPNAWNYPLGSGSSSSVTVTNPVLDSGGNLLTNSRFEDFTSNVPDNWAISVGTAGTTILAGNTSYYGDISVSLNLVGNGSQLTTIKQVFDDGTNGTATALEPNTVYGVFGVVKMDSTPAAGVLALSLCRQSDDAIVADDASTNNTITKDLTTVSTTWVPFGGFFRTPKALPASGLEFKVHLTTALTSGRNAYLHVAMCQAVQQYGNDSGPYIAAFRGSVDTILNDLYTLTVANDYGGKVQSLLDRWLNLRAMEKQFPSASSPTILDTVVP